MIAHNNGNTTFTTTYTQIHKYHKESLGEKIRTYSKLFSPKPIQYYYIM